MHPPAELLIEEIEKLRARVAELEAEIRNLEDNDRSLRRRFGVPPRGGLGGPY